MAPSMMKPRAPRFQLVAACAAVAALAGPPSASASARERAEIPEKYRWDLADIFPSVDAWSAAKDEVARRIPELTRFKGRLGQSPGALYAALSERMETELKLSRVSVYASMLSDEDKRISKHQELDQVAKRLWVDYGAAVAYMRPELLALGATKLRALVGAEKRLAPYRVWLEDLLRWAPHTLSAAEERVLAMAGRLAGAGGTTHEVFTNSELPFPEVVLSDGQKVRLDAQAYTRWRASPVAADRQKVFQAFWTRYRQFERTLGTTLFASIKERLLDRDARKFNSSVEAALFRVNVPTAVYRQLISDVHANLPTLHRYLRLRQKMLGLKTLGYEDLYAPVVPALAERYTPERAMELTLSAVDILGPEYVAAVKKSFDERWVDWEPSPGKRPGAYSTEGVYGVHPYQLMNFAGLYEHVSTLAHETGHTMHTYFSNRDQPYVTSNYPIFVAEVASTANEVFLVRSMLARTQDARARLALLGNRLDSLRTTLFRQTLLAEFELQLHERAEKGEALTGEAMSAAYLDLLRKYYGAAEGVTRVDPLYAIEWAYIPHFYSGFYVYQYATSAVASATLARGILMEREAGEGTKKRDAYLRLLSAGSSKYPLELLKDAGVDLTTSQPFSAAIAEMNQLMDEMEALLAQQKNERGR